MNGIIRFYFKFKNARRCFSHGTSIFCKIYNVCYVIVNFSYLLVNLLVFVERVEWQTYDLGILAANLLKLKPNSCKYHYCDPFVYQQHSRLDFLVFVVIEQWHDNVLLCFVGERLFLNSVMKINHNQNEVNKNGWKHSFFTSFSALELHL